MASIEATYKKVSQLEHVLLRPDTYVGSVTSEKKTMWILDEDSAKFVEREITYVPGLYKIFDEILVNAADNFQRDRRMTKIQITLDAKNSMIEVMNNGKGKLKNDLGIPVQMHAQHKLYVPELIFGHLLTSSNYDDTEKKVTGGRNGFGAKLANIFSSSFSIEAADHKKKKLFKMNWSGNMKEHSKPEITDYEGEDYTIVRFHPDLKLFHMKNLSTDMVSLFKKRAYDLAGIMDKKVGVWLNGKKIKIENFKDYVNLYDMEESQQYAKCHEVINNRWEVIVTVSENQFMQASFVNSICTSRGGTHVSAIVDQLTERISEQIKKKHKDLTVKPFQIKNNLAVFVNCLVENPAFDSQTKETLMTKSENFGSDFNLSEKFIKDVLKSGVMDFIIAQAKAKERTKIQKALSGKKASKLTGIPKLDDANAAGTKDSQRCQLILTEGDSAKALAMSGLDVVGRDYYGVFPLRGKLLNVRDANPTQLKGNAEIQSIVKIIGLQFDTDYQDVSSLRYGGILIMADQDNDGSHIKGLVINFIHYFWPSLLKINRFLKEFVTPVIKASVQGGEQQSFFTLNDYRQWQEGLPEPHGRLQVKFYKGLGTSTAKEAREYFKEISKHTINFKYTGKEDDTMIDLAFSKTKADDRKLWIEGGRLDDTVDHAVKNLTYTDFINKELMQYSVAANARAVPSVVDGLKPGQRKILFSCFKRSLKNEIKVAQLSGYVAEHSAYHHGEASLAMTIVNLAQDYMGSNNLNILEPLGQFGTRHQGGKDYASPRYIFTKLCPLTRMLYPEPDDAILNFLNDDGMKIEPEYYTPILPMVLVNGATGIGMGWSTFVPCYNPLDLIRCIRKLIQGETLNDQLVPWYYGFKGNVHLDEATQNCTLTGKYKISGIDTLEITELPVGTWTGDYKTFLESMMEGDKNSQQVSEIREYHSQGSIHFVVTFKLGKLDEIRDNLEKKMKLTCSLSLRNMVLFNTEGKITRYDTPNDILLEFYGVRLRYYTLRKEHLLRILKAELQVLGNKVRFINSILDGSLEINNRKKSELVRVLQEREYMSVNSGSQTDDHGEDENADGGLNYNYLLGMKLWSLTHEKVESLRDLKAKKEAEYTQMEKITEKELWLADLANFEISYNQYIRKRNLLNFGKEEVRAQTTTVEKGAIAEKKKPALVEDRKPSAKKSESDIMKEEITEITPQKAKNKPKKLALSTSEESASPKPTKSLKQPKVQKSNPHSEKQKSERKIIQKTSSSKLVKRPPSKAKKPYDSEEESSTKIKAKPASKLKSQSKTKKVQLDDSDLELIQKNSKVITKDDKSSIRKSKIKSTEQLSDSDSNSEPSELSYESESEYS